MAARSYPNPHGRPPKADSQRRRRNVPKSYGQATPTTAAAATPATRELNIGPEHPFVASMWAAMQQSCESAFYSAADWERARMELWHLNQILTGAIDLTAANWQRVQSGFDEMLLSPAVKRRAGIEMRPAVDEDENAAVSMIGQYRQSLRPV